MTMIDVLSIKTDICVLFFNGFLKLSADVLMCFSSVCL